MLARPVGLAGVREPLLDLRRAQRAPLLRRAARSPARAPRRAARRRPAGRCGRDRSSASPPAIARMRLILTHCYGGCGDADPPAPLPGTDGARLLGVHGAGVVPARSWSCCSSAGCSARCSTSSHIHGFSARVVRPALLLRLHRRARRATGPRRSAHHWYHRVPLFITIDALTTLALVMIVG